MRCFHFSRHRCWCWRFRFDRDDGNDDEEDDPTYMYCVGGWCFTLLPLSLLPLPLRVECIAVAVQLNCNVRLCLVLKLTRTRSERQQKRSPKALAECVFWRATESDLNTIHTTKTLTTRQIANTPPKSNFKPGIKRSAYPDSETFRFQHFNFDFFCTFARVAFVACVACVACDLWSADPVIDGRAGYSNRRPTIPSIKLNK